MHSNTWGVRRSRNISFQGTGSILYLQARETGREEKRKEGGRRETYWSRQPHQKKRKSTLFPPHKLDRYCKCTWRLRKKYSLASRWRKKVKTLLFRAALDVFSLALQAPPLPLATKKV